MEISEKPIAVATEETRLERAGSLRGALFLALTAAWAGIVLIRFFAEHPFSTPSFVRLLINFQIPLQISLEKIFLIGKHLALSLLIMGSALLAGRLLLRIVGIRRRGENVWHIAQHFLLALGLGWGFLMYAVFLLGVLGFLDAQAIWLLMLAILIVGFPEARRVSEEMRAAISERPAGGRVDALGFGVLALAIVAGSALLVALSPSITHDAMVYHLNVPRIYATSHRIVPIPYNLFSNTVLNMEMLYALTLCIDDFVLANLLHFSMGAAALAATYVFARPILGRAVAQLAVLILFFNPLVLNEISIAYVDLAMVFYFLLMTACLWNWKETDDLRWFVLFCVFSGIFAGIKYTSLYGLGAAGAAVVAAGLSPRKRAVRGFLLRLAVFGGVVSICVLPYLVKNYLFTGNPVYPLMYNLFKGEWLTPGQVERMLAYVDSHGMGRDWRHLATLPWNITIFGNPGFEHFDAIITPLWLIFVPAFLLIRHTPAALKWAFFVCAAYFGSWMASTHITRYLMPIFPLLSLIAAYSMIALIEKSGGISKKLRMITAAALAATCGITWFFFSYFYPLRAPREFGAVVWGHQPRDEFLAKIVPAYAAFQYINKNLPDDARLAFFWDNRGFFCERRQIGDSVFEAPSMLELVHQSGSAGAFHEKLRSMGIYYILFNELYYSKFPPFATSAEDQARLAEDYRIFREFLKGYCLPFFTADGTTLYAVHV